MSKTKRLHVTLVAEDGDRPMLRDFFATLRTSMRDALYDLDRRVSVDFINNQDRLSLVYDSEDRVRLEFALEIIVDDEFTIEQRDLIAAAARKAVDRFARLTAGTVKIIDLDIELRNITPRTVIVIEVEVPVACDADTLAMHLVADVVSYINNNATPEDLGLDDHKDYPGVFCSITDNRNRY